MLQQVVDFRAEADELHTLLVGLKPEDWARATLFKSWTVNDIVQHLHAGDLLAAASVAGPEPFARLQAEIRAQRDRGMSRLQETRHRLAHLAGQPLREQWYAQMIKLCDQLAVLPADTRLKWAGPDMGVRMFATARQMENWAHGQAVYDLVGARRQPTNRLRNIAELGVRTFRWTFTNRGVPVAEPAPYVRLAAPSGDTWEWNDPSPDNSIQGHALDFCQVVTQVRNVADTTLQVIGAPAQAWMSMAQCFAGPPEDPPHPGTRFSATASPGQ